MLWFLYSIITSALITYVLFLYRFLRFYFLI